MQLDPIYVNFNVNEQDVLRIREEARRRGLTVERSQAVADRGRLADRERLSAQGQARLRLADLNQSTGTLAVRGILPNPDRVLLPGFFVRVRVPFEQSRQNALLVPDVALGSDQAGRAMCWS